MAIDTASARSMATRCGITNSPLNPAASARDLSPMRRRGDRVPREFFNTLKREEVYLHDYRTFRGGRGARRIADHDDVLWLHLEASLSLRTLVDDRHQARP